VRAHEALVARHRAEAEEAARQAEAERALAARRAEEERLAVALRAEQERLDREEAARREAEAARLAEAKRQEDARLARMAGLLLAPARVGDRPRLGLAIATARSESEPDRAAALALAAALARAAGEGLHIVPNAFAPAFFAEGHFARALAGDPAPLAEARAFDRLDHLLLGTASADCQPNRQIAGLTACRVALALRLLAADGSVVESTEISSTGPGVSEPAAVARGAELLVERQGRSCSRGWEVGHDVGAA
jgi:hypothetical protein